MKSFTCYDCDTSFQSETSKEMLDLLYPHYMGEHKEIIMGASEEEKVEWMKKFNIDWEAAETL